MSSGAKRNILGSQGVQKVSYPSYFGSYVQSGNVCGIAKNIELKKEK